MNNEIKNEIENKNKNKKVDLRNIIHSNYEGQPQITKFKGNKTLFKQKIQTKKIYDYYEIL